MGYVFEGTGQNGFVSTATMLKLAKSVRGDVDMTSHGFRSTFRNWVGETRPMDRFAAELALAHVVKGVEGVYFTSDLLEQRVDLMEAWAQRCASNDDSDLPANVTPIRKRRSA